MTTKNVLTWMPKSYCFRTAFANKLVQRSQTLLNSAWQHFYPNFPLMQDKLNWKTCVWIRSKILGPFVNTLTADSMYSPHNWEKFQQQFKTQLSKKRKIISGFLLHFWNINKIFFIWKKMPASYPKYFRSYWLRKMFLLECQKATL